MHCKCATNAPMAFTEVCLESVTSQHKNTHNNKKTTRVQSGKSFFAAKQTHQKRTINAP